MDHPLVHFQFAPTDEGNHVIDEVKLDVQEKDGQALGILTITPVQHSLREHLRSLVGKDDVHHEVAFSLDALATDEEGNVGEEVAAQLREWFDPYLSNSDETVANE